MGSEASVQGSNPEPLMSALGQKQTLALVHLMSALPPKADIAERQLDVRFVPKVDIPKNRLIHAGRGSREAHRQLSAIRHLCRFRVPLFRVRRP
jgi:hypothetical protein